MKIFEASKLKDTDVIIQINQKEGKALWALLERATEDPKALTKLRKGTVQYKLAQHLQEELPIW